MANYTVYFDHKKVGVFNERNIFVSSCPYSSSYIGEYTDKVHFIKCVHNSIHLEFKDLNGRRVDYN